MLVSSKLIRNGTALERPKIFSKRRCHCQEARTWDDQSATQTVNLGSLFRGGFLDPISCISHVIVLILGPKNVPKIGPKSSGLLFVFMRTLFITSALLSASWVMMDFRVEDHLFMNRCTIWHPAGVKT